MAFRVSTEERKTITVIRVDGYLTSTDVDDLRGACELAKSPLLLVLSGLRSADADGVRALQSLSEAGAKLHDADPYISQLLLVARTK